MREWSERHSCNRREHGKQAFEMRPRPARECQWNSECLGGVGVVKVDYKNGNSDTGCERPRFIGKPRMLNFILKTVED